MTIDTKLRDAAESVRQARRRAEFTVKAPSTRRRVVGGLRVAAVVAVVALLLIGIPAVLRGGNAGRSEDVAGSIGDASTQSSLSGSDDIAVSTTIALDDTTGSSSALIDAPSGFVFLGLDTPGWNPTYTETTSEGGFAAEINYEQLTEDGSGGLMVLRTQTSGTYGRFEDLTSMSTSSDEVTVGGRDMTLYLIPKESMVEESDSDVYAATWTESDTSVGYAIAFGLTRQEFLDALNGLTTPSAETWHELKLMSQVVTTTTMVETANGKTP